MQYINKIIPFYGHLSYLILSYLMFKSHDDWQQPPVPSVDAWKKTSMVRNKLKPYPEKIEIIIFHKRSQQIIYTLHLQSGPFEPLTEVRDLGVILDSTLSMESQINSVVRSCRHQLRSIAKIRRSLSKDACQTLISTLVFSRMDYVNSLLAKLPKSQTRKLQLVQDSRMLPLAC